VLQKNNFAIVFSVGRKLGSSDILVCFETPLVYFFFFSSVFDCDALQPRDLI
jgi:hypothetical protein